MLKMEPIYVVMYGASKDGAEAAENKAFMTARLGSLLDQELAGIFVCHKKSECVLHDPSGLIEWIGTDRTDGNAGCLRRVFPELTNGVVVMLPLDLIELPDIAELVALHRRSEAVLSVLANAGNSQVGIQSSIYVLDPSLTGHIPEHGYWDINENLIPELVVLGKKVQLLPAPEPQGKILVDASRDFTFDATDKVLAANRHKLRRLEYDGDADVWVADQVRIAPSSRLYGRIVLLKGASIGEDAVVIGPAVMAEGACVSPKFVYCQDRFVEDTNGTHGRTFDDDNYVCASDMKQKNFPSNRDHPISHDLPKLLWGVLLLGAFLWSYWSTLIDIWQIWMRSDEYSSGLLVPILAGYVLWGRRRQVLACPIRPMLLLGGCGLFVAIGMKFIGLYSMYGFLERLSIVVAIWALVLWFAGKRLFLEIGTVLLFLLLMLPWPNRVQSAIALPLQQWSTHSAVFCLELIGYPVIQEGNIIQIEETRVAVAEACNGLRMITAFFVIGGLVALLSKRAWWEKVILLASCLPIALICNTIRLAATSIAFTKISVEQWEQLFHDFGGYAMMPLALALVVLELWILERLFVSETVERRDIISRTIETGSIE